MDDASSGSIIHVLALADGAPDDIFGIVNSYGPDITVTAASGPYTLEPGESLPFTFASVHGSSQADLINNARLTQILFNNDYESASGPPIPRVEAVPGDGKITLYWDDTAERGVYLDGTVGDPLTGNNAFQGYKIFRSDDGGQTFGQAIIDFQGTTQGYIPLAIYDLADGITGESETRRYFDQGTDSGLQHKFVDTNVENGKEYIYGVVAYDSQDGPVPPLETPLNLANPNDPGDNTVAVRPMARSAGVVPGVAEASARHIAGNADLDAIDIEVVDASRLQSGTYQITFDYDADSGDPVYGVFRDGQGVDDMSGKAMSGIGLFDAETDFAPTFDGMRAFVVEVPFGWSREEQTGSGGLVVSRFRTYQGTPATLAADYEFRFTDRLWTYTDWDTGGPITAPFEIFNITTGEKVHAELWDDRGDQDGTWDFDERIYIVTYPYPENEADAGGWLGSWPDDYSYYALFGDASSFQPGDVVTLYTNKPYTPSDVYEFSVTGQSADRATLEADLEEITVVPNPFTVSSEYEIGAFGVQKQLQFHQMPETATIRIFTIAGDLVQVVEHSGGSVATWNLQTYNGQEVSYGVYLYIVETPEGLEQTGKFAIIK